MKWTAEQLKTIAETHDLFVSPFREDGTTYGTPTQTWALVVGGNVYVRAANGQESRWYQAAVTQKAGRVRVADTYHDVMFEAAGTTDEAAIDALRSQVPGQLGRADHARPRPEIGLHTNLASLDQPTTAHGHPGRPKGTRHDHPMQAPTPADS
jgi:hypothetical protein